MRRKTNLTLLIVPLFALLIATSDRAIATPPAKTHHRHATPAMLALPCTGCHGADGASAAADIPNLAGQTRMALVDALLRFKSGERPATVMGRLAKGYSEREIAALAEYFATRTRATPVQTNLSSDLIERGRRLHAQYCAACHHAAPQPQSPSAALSPVPALTSLSAEQAARNAPILAHQWLAYLQTQMDDFATGRRAMAQPMAEQFRPRSRAELEALAHFYASGAANGDAP